MSEQQPAPHDPKSLRTALAGAKADVLAALELGKSLSTSELSELRQVIEEALSAYNLYLAAAPPEKHVELEHSLGKQAIDLRRAAAMLPQLVGGRATALSADKVAGGGQPFIETRAPGKSISDTPGPRRSGSDPRPGDEVDAWCGPCDGLRTHNIIAVVDKRPKQVVCQSCGGRHGFRLTAARARAKEPGPPQATGLHYIARKTPEQINDERKKQEATRLKLELDKVENVQPFDPKRRYKAGQVIVHAEHGRGKIENTLKYSMLVRFPVGLKSLTLK